MPRTFAFLPIAFVLAVATLVPARARAAELLVVERAGCAACLRWEREIAPIYPRTPEAARAPLRRLDIHEAAGLPLAEPVRYTPSFVLVEGGQEVGRVTGYADAAMFWGLLGRLLDRLEEKAP